MALRYLTGERASVSLQPTALVNEVCLRLLGWGPSRWQNRGHFFGVSAQMMRRVLVDIARRRRAERRGGAGTIRVPLDDVDLPACEAHPDLVAIDEALEQLAREDPRKARVVELRFFGGLSVEETAETLAVSPRTVHKDGSSRAPGCIERSRAAGPHDCRSLAACGTPIRRGAAATARHARGVRRGQLRGRRRVARGGSVAAGRADRVERVSGDQRPRQPGKGVCRRRLESPAGGARRNLPCRTAARSGWQR